MASHISCRKNSSAAAVVSRYSRSTLPARLSPFISLFFVSFFNFSLSIGLLYHEIVGVFWISSSYVPYFSHASLKSFMVFQGVSIAVLQLAENIKRFR